MIIRPYSIEHSEVERIRGQETIGNTTLFDLFSFRKQSGIRETEKQNQGIRKQRALRVVQDSIQKAEEYTALAKESHPFTNYAGAEDQLIRAKQYLYELHPVRRVIPLWKIISLEEEIRYGRLTNEKKPKSPNLR